MKSERLSIRIHPADKQILEYLAECDVRSVADEVAVLIRQEWSRRSAELEVEPAHKETNG